MATYAAYRHIELDNVGYGKKRVLKPPGGGSSDIFGSGEDGGAARRIQKNHLASNVFLSDEPAPSTPSRSPVANGDSHDGADTPVSNGNTSPVTNGNRITNGGAQMTNGGAQAQAPASRNRVPPGGYSSGLW